MTACSYCGHPGYVVTCPNGRQHFVIQHAEGGCPQWYDVGGCFEDGYCALCPTTPHATFVGPNPFE